MLLDFVAIGNTAPCAFAGIDQAQAQTPSGCFWRNDAAYDPAHIVVESERNAAIGVQCRDRRCNREALHAGRGRVFECDGSIFDSRGDKRRIAVVANLPAYRDFVRRERRFSRHLREERRRADAEISAARRWRWRWTALLFALLLSAALLRERLARKQRALQRRQADQTRHNRFAHRDNFPASWAQQPGASQGAA